jgi:hypothetical protein
VTSLPPEIDTDTYDLPAFLGDQFGEVIAQLREQTAALNISSRSPKRQIAIRSGSTDAAGYLYIAFPAVPQGFSDDVYNVVIGGVRAAAPGAVAGYANLVERSSPHVGDIAIETSAIVDIAPELPNVGFYDPGELVIHQGNHLGIQIYDSTFSLTAYAAVVRYVRRGH